MVNSRYVAVLADPVVASFHQTHIHFSFNIVIQSCYHSLIGANKLVVGLVVAVPSLFGMDLTNQPGGE
jgi:hypothetical protein